MNPPQDDWQKILDFFARKFTGGEPPSLDTILYLLGVQEVGQGTRRYSKQEKIDLMHVGLCTILEQTGHCRRTGATPDGWPLFEQKKSLPPGDRERESLLRQGLIAYFRRNGLLD